MQKVKKMRLLDSVIILTALGLSALFLMYLKTPFIYVGLIFFFTSAFFFIRSSGNRRVVWFNIAVIILLITALETYLWLFKYEYRDNYRYEGDYNREKYYFQPHDFLGYAPQKGITVHSKKSYQDQLLYDVTYSIDEQGLRTSPRPVQATHCAVFFGCSLTFGEGVNDDETMPYQVGLLAKDSLKIYNFGFHGYGPHQMLAAIENGMVDSIIQCKDDRILFVYQGLILHALRSSGKITWGEHAPRYVLRNGELVYKGRFDESAWYTNPILSNVLTILKKSAIYDKTAEKRRTLTNADVKLFIAIIKKSQSELKKRFPNSKFAVILWNNERDEFYSMVKDGLEKNGIDVHWIYQILSDYNRNHRQYRIHEIYEKHPNATAHKLVARYVYDQLVVPFVFAKK